MIQVLADDADVAHGERPLGKIVVADRGLQLLQAHRKVGVLHLCGEGLFQTAAGAARRVNVPLIARLEERGKKGHPLDMVPMRMANQDMSAERARARLEKRLPQSVGAGPAVKHSQCAGG